MTVATSAGGNYEKVGGHKCPLCMGDKVKKVYWKRELFDIWECPCCDLKISLCPHRVPMK